MTDNQKKRAVAWWLIAGILMIVVEFIMGGVTRLTGSGLSITEWKPIMGAIPPLNETEWNKAFDGYKQIAQYKYMNSHFTLPDFKFIFFWEWSHRLWARLLGVVFGIGFAWFFVKKYFDQKMTRPFIILFVLGGLQGFIGWKMVQSGLNDTSMYVKHTWLATHFLSAMGLMCYTLWFALKLLVPDEKRVADKKLRNYTFSIIALLFVQLAFGAFMAGLHAAKVAPTWPTINGMWIPDSLTHRNLIGDSICVQFVHRSLAYLLLLLIVLWFGAVARSIRSNNIPLLAKVMWWPLLLVLLQVVLGIVTVLSAPLITFNKFGTFEIMAELHQLVAMFLLMATVVNFYIVTKRSP